jgi:hypothetical protein
MNMGTLCEVREPTQDHRNCIGLPMQFARPMDFPSGIAYRFRADALGLWRRSAKFVDTILKSAKPGSWWSKAVFALVGRVGYERVQPVIVDFAG